MIDLSKCKSGDKLRVRMTPHMSALVNGEFTDVVTYVEPINNNDQFEHSIQYSNGGYGYRTNNGKCFKYSTEPNDMDVVEIIG